MSIQEESKTFKHSIHPDVFTGILLIVVAVVSFGLGKLTSVPGMATYDQMDTLSQHGSIQQEVGYEETTPTVVVEQDPAPVREQYVASKNGSKYHLPWCGSATTIKEENKIWFNSKEEAEAAGYTPASNCKGI